MAHGANFRMVQIWAGRLGRIQSEVQNVVALAGTWLIPANKVGSARVFTSGWVVSGSEGEVQFGNTMTFIMPTDTATMKKNITLKADIEYMKSSPFSGDTSPGPSVRYKHHGLGIWGLFPDHDWWLTYTDGKSKGQHGYFNNDGDFPISASNFYRLNWFCRATQETDKYIKAPTTIVGETVKLTELGGGAGSYAKDSPTLWACLFFKGYEYGSSVEYSYFDALCVAVKNLWITFS